jgi:hypothetical protein
MKPDSFVNLLEPSGPAEACIGIVIPYLTLRSDLSVQRI